MTTTIKAFLLLIFISLISTINCFGQKEDTRQILLDSLINLVNNTRMQSTQQVDSFYNSLPSNMRLLLDTLIEAGLDLGNGNVLSRYRKHQLENLVSLVKDDRVLELSEKIIYPIRRPNPIPDVKNKEEFLQYYPNLFDSAFKSKFINAKFETYNTTDSYLGFGILGGEIWLDDKGNILEFYHQSPQEISIQEKLHKDQERIINPSVKPWKENRIMCETENYTVRIDLMDNDELRYVSWAKPKTIREKPDLMLFRGTPEYQGELGDYSYIFQNNEWSYELDYNGTSPRKDEQGLFLRVYHNHKLEKESKCVEKK
jgi:hypothetical protein